MTRRGNMRPFRLKFHANRKPAVVIVDPAMVTRAKLCGGLRCRVCERPIAESAEAIGDHVLELYAGSSLSCVACGYYKLADFCFGGSRDDEASTNAFHRAVLHNRLDEVETRLLATMGLVEPIDAKRSWKWTAVGRRLREEFKKARAA
jgi:hypothetical protein